MDPQPSYSHPREFTRVRLSITALVTINDATVPLSVRDVCLDGIGVQAEVPIEQGAGCTVELRRDTAPEEPWITAHGTVVRVAADVVGIHFHDLEGIDSLHHLRALIMYHADDADKVLAEFDAHWGLRPK